MHFQPNNDAGSRAQGLKLTPFIGDGNMKQDDDWEVMFSPSLKLTPFIGDGNTTNSSTVLGYDILV